MAVAAGLKSIGQVILMGSISKLEGNKDPDRKLGSKGEMWFAESQSQHHKTQREVGAERQGLNN